MSSKDAWLWFVWWWAELGEEWVEDFPHHRQDRPYLSV